MASKKSKKKEEKEKGALFIPAGIFLGMGFGFLYGQLVPGLFIGLGTGFVLFAITHALSKNKNK